MNNEEGLLFLKALNTWGRIAQVNVAIEEFAELIKELAKYGRLINGSNKKDIINEMVDAEIMLEQMKITFRDDYLYTQIRKKKLDRLRKMLK